MEKIVLDSAIKFGAGRYRQEKGLLEECGKVFHVEFKNKYRTRNQIRRMLRY